MSTDADRTHGVCSQPCAMCHAEEIAQLTAELAEARSIVRERDQLRRDRDAERAAHERTKAELAQMEARAQSAWAEVRDAIESLKIAHAERDAAIAREQSVQAEAATLCVGNHFIVRPICCGRADPTYGPCSYAEAEAFRDSYLSGVGVGGTGHHRSAIIEASGSIAARVPLLEAVAKAAATFVEHQHFEKLTKLLRALAALNTTKGG